MVSIFATMADLLTGSNPIDRSKVKRYGENPVQQNQGTSIVKDLDTKCASISDNNSKQNTSEIIDKVNNSVANLTVKRKFSKCTQQEDETNEKKMKSTTPKQNFRNAKSTTNRRKTQKSVSGNEKTDARKKLPRSDQIYSNRISLLNSNEEKNAISIASCFKRNVQEKSNIFTSLKLPYNFDKTAQFFYFTVVSLLQYLLQTYVHYATTFITRAVIAHKIHYVVRC